MNKPLSFVKEHLKKVRILSIIDGDEHYVVAAVKKDVKIDAAVNILYSVDKKSGKVEEYSMFNPEYKKIYRNVVYKYDEKEE